MSVLIVGTFMSVLDTSIVNVAVPKIQVELSAAPDDVEWVVTGYTLVLGIVVPLSGWLGERIGMTRLYILSMVGFALASALCGMAWDLGSMIVFRVVQAIPGGILPVVTMTMLFLVVPQDRMGSAMGIYGLGVVVAPAVWPVLGGYLVEYVDWRLIFFINVPIGVLGTVAALAVFPRVRPTTWPRFDVWGFVTIAYGLFALLLATSEGQSWGWDGYRIRGLIVSGVLSLALFVVIELEVDNPLIDLRIFRVWAYTNSIILLGVAVTGLFTVLYFVPQFLQIVQGLQALESGLVLVPSALILLVLMPVAGRLYDRFGPRWPVVVGLLIMAYGSFLMADITPDTPRVDLQLWTTIRNLGTGLAMMPIFTAGITALPPSLTSAGSGMNNVMQRVASSIAVAIFGSLGASSAAQLMYDRGSLLATGAQALPQVAAATDQGAPGLLGMYQALNLRVLTQTYTNGFYAVGILCVGGAVLALLLPSGSPSRGNGEPMAIEM
ncbi:DHA2 family efflux MFS transporter permease subunit [Pseudonocardia spinosispora]|uniref:DHA2 family efflux MFS transporter permease subunit n=1 Tax=Pseudonocardia spinosispora TaxID=103441 RepID=UPI00146FBDA9|nr:DHA2 family efflux MFS transporter permease subunit [Pseudonocardia spinosispora]